ncbi:MAG: hypothetical protein L0Z51_01995, partial [Candidatus Latescibacteria bacterium]|nr:hypothetical protein [Candidatus Latescibacterota bacterium]
LSSNVSTRDWNYGGREIIAVGRWNSEPPDEGRALMSFPLPQGVGSEQIQCLGLVVVHRRSVGIRRQPPAKLVELR